MVWRCRADFRKKHRLVRSKLQHGVDGIGAQHVGRLHAYRQSPPFVQIVVYLRDVVAGISIKRRINIVAHIALRRRLYIIF